MNRVRGIVMLLVGCFALYESWRVLHGQRAVWALLLGLAALALAAWHLTRPPERRMLK
jgi:drug/metabolite transporter superfamily protein YnfA